MTDISNSDDVIDSRDVEERIDELESERADLVEALDNIGDDEDAEGKREAATDALVLWDDENVDELKALIELRDEAEGYAPDWRYGATLIRESYFEDYVREMLEDCGDLPKDLPHYIVIDWEATASNIRMDYTTVDFDGVDYLVR